MAKCFQSNSYFLLSVCSFALTLFLSPSVRAERPVPMPPPNGLDKLQTLAGNTRAEATTQNDRGRVPDSFAMDHMMMQLQRSPAQEKAVTDFIDSQHNSASPNFHQWLTAVEFGKRFGPSAAELDKVCAWLRSSGFTVNSVYPGGTLIDFSGTAGQVAIAFRTEIHRLEVDGKQHFANMSDPKIPVALAATVTGIVALHDFRPHPLHKPHAQYTVGDAGYTFHLLVPADLYTIYDLNAAFKAGYTGQGQTIALAEDSDLYDPADWSTFRSVLGLSGYTSGSLVTVNPQLAGGASNCSDPGPSGDDIEATLDVEWASAAAPNASIVLAACADEGVTFGVLTAAQNLVNGAKPPQIISVSYGECEANNGAAANAAYNAMAQQAVAEGISVFAAAGDEGAASCDAGYSSATHGLGISALAASPYSVAVGGTDFADMSLGSTHKYWTATNSSTYGSAVSYIPEIPWNDSCAGSILSVYEGYSTGYGADGFCGTSTALLYGSITVGAGSGGPSECATGAPTVNQVVSGSCQGYAKPSWQTATGNPSDGVRDIPDVSLFAATGIWGHYYVTCFSDPANGGAPCTGAPINWGGAGGTSFASPIMAGIQALVNQKMGGAQGNPNPVYYKLAASSVASLVFHPVTTGDITVNCSGEIACFGASFEGRGRATPITTFVGNGALSTSSQKLSPAYPAAAGWNFATGLGSVDVFNLISNWSAGQ